MREKDNLAKQPAVIEKTGDEKLSTDELFKLLVDQLSVSFLTCEEVLKYQQEFEKALKKSLLKGTDFSQTELLKTDLLLINKSIETCQVDYAEDLSADKITTLELVRKAVLLLVAVALITLGFSMIILPAPPYFEMFTVFYFNDDDGVTIMDLISLIIILFGVYLFVTTVIKFKKV